MGTYTQLYISVNLRPDTPDLVLSVLQNMLQNQMRTWARSELPDHPLFKTPRYDDLLGCNRGCFPGSFGGSLAGQQNSGSVHRLTAQCSLKNYHNEIGLFLDWIRPYVCEGSSWPEFVGFVNPEADNYLPTWVVFCPEGVRYVDPGVDLEDMNFKLKRIHILRGAGGGGY
jgi:hypothetical protein